jgi:hypothetical protein
MRPKRLRAKVVRAPRPPMPTVMATATAMVTAVVGVTATATDTATMTAASDVLWWQRFTDLVKGGKAWQGT